MNKFNFLMFVDDDYATNYYHEHVVKKAEVCDKYKFYDKPGEALEYFETILENKELEVPDVIFLDINMPKIDGWMFLERYNSLSIPKTPIVIMLTTSLNPKDKQRAEESQLVHGFITKPLAKDHLMELGIEIAKSQQN